MKIDIKPMEAAAVIASTCRIVEPSVKMAGGFEVSELRVIFPLGFCLAGGPGEPGSFFSRVGGRASAGQIPASRNLIASN